MRRILLCTSVLLASCTWLSTLTADLRYMGDHAAAEYRAGNVTKPAALRCNVQVGTEIKRAENGSVLLTKKAADASLARAAAECK